MRLVRVDRLAPGGAALELHPRLTVLRGASIEQQRRLVQALRSLVDGSEPELGGMIEVGGVRLALDRSTLDQLRLDPRVDPVLDLGDTGVEVPTSAPGPAPGRGGATPGESEHGFSPRRAHADPFGGAERARGGQGDRSALRAELREVTQQRTALAERMELTRQGLDSFSRAALDVCRGQIEALESRRIGLRRQWEGQLEQRAARRGELERELFDQRAASQTLGDVDPSAVAAARELLAATLEVPDRPDPAAADLADQIEAAVRDLARRGARRAEQTTGYEDASRELVEARRHLAEVEQSAGATVDPAVVRRLEQVREELFASDEGLGRLSSGKGRRRVQELRAEEAVLLDRLGFDTYSAYVMGIPSVRAGLERNERLTAARERVQAAEARLGAVRAAEGEHEAARRALEELVALVERAEAMLHPDGQPPAPPTAVAGEPWFTRPAGPAPTAAGDGGSEQGAEVTRRADAVAQRLRARRTAPPAPDSPSVRDAMRSLDAALSHVGVPTHDLAPSGPGAPRALLHAADRWLAGVQDREHAARRLRERIGRLESELAAIDRTPEPERDVQQWARVEADLDAALDRLAEAEERVRAHEEAMDRLADLRSEELALRERERELLARISRAEQGDGPPQPPPFRGVPPTGAEPEAPRPMPRAADAFASMSGTGSPRTAGPGIDVHWRLVCRLAEQRAVSFAGSLPLLVQELPEQPEVRDRLLERMDAMADLVQIVVLSEDPAVGGWAATLGHRAAIVAL